MKIVGYMLKRFFGIFLGALLFFILILSLTDLFMNLWNYISKNVTSQQVAEIMLLYIPKTIWFSVPIAMLFATAYMLSDFYAKNELLAIFASGISLFKFTAPLLLVAVFMSFGLFFFEDNIVVPTYAKKQQIQQQVLHKEKSLNNDKIVIMACEGRVVYKADYFDNKLQKLYSVYILFRTEDKTFESVIYADNAEWLNNKWKLNGAVEYALSGEEVSVVPLRAEHLLLLTEPPETFRNNTVSVEEVNTREARAYIARSRCSI